MGAFPARGRKLGREELFDYAVRLLGQRALTARELRERLERRATSAGDVAAALERLRSLDYVDDARTAESHVAGRRDFSRFGSRRVLMELRRRGIAPEIAEQTVAKAYESVDEVELIREHLRRKLATAPEGAVKDPKRLARLQRALLRAGFRSDRIGEVLRTVSAEPEWADALDEVESEAASEG